MLNFFWIIGAGKIDQVGSIFGNGPVITKLLDFGYIMFHPHKLHIPVFDLPCPEPYVHDTKENTADNNGYITAMREFIKVGKKKTEFNRQVHYKVQVYPVGAYTMA